MYLTLATPGGGIISRIKWHSVLFLAIVMIVQCGVYPVSAGADKVESVTVKVSAVGAAPPSRVISRIEASISTVGEHVLMGKRLDDLAANRASYERIVQEVFDRVLIGYSVERVEIVPSAAARILVTVRPWGDVVRAVSVQLDLSAVSPDVHELIKKDLGNIEDSISSVLIGLPVDAVDWAGGVSRSVVRELVAARLPEFRASLDVISGPDTQVKLSLSPLGPTVQDVNVVLRSNTIPNVLLWEARPKVETSAKILRGLPVEFVQRNQDYFRTRFTQSIAEHPAARRYGLAVHPEIRAGTDTTVSITADTSKYKVTLEGYMDIDKEEDNLTLKLHAGKLIGKYDELFAEVSLLPNSMSWRFAPGWGRKLGASTEAGIKYDISASHAIIWMNQQVNPKWSLRVERTPDIERNEVGVRYRLHEFMSVEYIFDNHDRWIRLVGNL